MGVGNPVRSKVMEQSIERVFRRGGSSDTNSKVYKNEGNAVLNQDNQCASPGVCKSGHVRLAGSAIARFHQTFLER